jgi:hypothetical protein
MGKYSQFIDPDDSPAPAVDDVPSIADEKSSPPAATPDAPNSLGKVWQAAKDAAPAFGYGAARGATLGAMDRLAGLGGAAGDALASVTHGLKAEPGQAFDEARSNWLRDEDKASKDHPIAKLVGEGIGGAVPAIASGGVSEFAPVAAAVPTLAESLAPVLTSQGGKMAAQGFAAGVMNERSPDAVAQLKAGVTGGALGAGTNAAAEKFVSPLIAKATQREARGLVESIVRNEETGASATPTAKKLLVPKLAAAVKELHNDPILAEAARTDAARAGRIVNAKIAAASQDRPRFYADLDAAHPPLTVADFYRSLHKAAQSAKNPSEEAALESFRTELDSHWLPKWERAGMLIPQPGKAQGVSSLAVRDWVSQAQEGAANTIGQINESMAKQRQDTLKHVASDLWQNHLDQAEGSAPDTVKAIRSYDARFSALASMRKVFQQRAEKEAAGTTGLTATLGKAGESIGTGAAAAYAFEHPYAALTGYAAMQAAKKAPQVARAVNDRMLVPLQEALAKGGGKMGWATFSQLAAERGLPQGLARTIYDRFQQGSSK